MSVALDEEELSRVKSHVLIKMRRELVRNIDAKRMLTFLRSKYVLDERDCDEIKSKASREACTETFIDILSRKGPRGYDEFCNAILHDRTQTFLLTSMNKTLEVMKAKVLELKTRAMHFSSPSSDPYLYHNSSPSLRLDSPQTPSEYFYRHHYSPDPFENYRPIHTRVNGGPPNQLMEMMCARGGSVKSAGGDGGDAPCGQSLPLHLSCSASP